MAQTVKNLPVLRATWVQSLGRKDPLEKGLATHSSILAWRVPWTEEPDGLQSMGSQSDTTEGLTLSLFISKVTLCLVSIGCLYSRVWVQFSLRLHIPDNFDFISDIVEIHYRDSGWSIIL